MIISSCYWECRIDTCLQKAECLYVQVHDDDSNCNIIISEVAQLAHSHVVITAFSQKELKYVLVY